MLLKSTLAALAAARIALAVPSLDIKGNAFVNPSTGKKFQIIGMAYQPGGEAGYKPEKGEDALSNGDVCRRDAALMQQLGVNAIRSYNLSPDLNHDECASIFNAAGIYMLLDVNAPGFGNSLNREEPWTTYYDGYLNRTFAIVEAFKDYPNTLAFFSANEVIDKPGTAKVVPPYLRAMQRDLKAYISKHSDRHIPVGYSAADVRDVLADTYNYLVCEKDGDGGAEAEFFALNSYSWCGPKATFKSSTYDKLVAQFKDSPVPIFFSEFGCNEPQPRYFNEVQSILGPDMTDSFSGGIVYEWTQEDNNYGVVDVADDGSIKLRQDYGALRGQYLKLDTKALQNGEPPSSSAKVPTCSAKLITEDDFNGNFTLPVLPPGGQDLINKGVKSAPVGKIVKIADYSFDYEIKDVNGNVIKDVKVEPLADDESNLPGAVADSGLTSSSASSSEDGGDNDSAAGVLRPIALVVAAVPALLAFFALA
jgi:hypothetical protein